MQDTHGSTIASIQTLHPEGDPEIRLTNERFLQSLRGSPITVWQQDLDLKFTWVYNPIVNIDASEVVGKRDAEILERPEDSQITEAIKLRVIETGQSARQIVSVHYGDVKRYFDLRVDPLIDVANQVVGIACVSIDVTEQETIAEALRESEERFRSVLDNASDFVYRFNLQTGGFDYVSPSTEAVTGYSVTEYLGMDLATGIDLVHPDDKEKVRSTIRGLKEGDRASLEYRLRSKTGEYRWLSNNMALVRDSSNGALYRYGSVRNITAIKREQQELRRLAGVVELSKDLIGIFGLDGRGLFLNEAGQRLVGLTSDTAQKTSVFEYLFPEDLPNIMNFIGTVMHSGSGSIETRFRHFITGEPIDVDHEVIVIRDVTTGEPCALATVTKDIREQKRIEAERIEINRKREQVSEAVQRSLLLAPASDAYPGIVTQPFYQSAYHDALIGGDFYDVFPVSDNVIALIVGDATGKGVAAATYTAEIKFVLRGYLRAVGGDLSAAVSLLNKFIAENIRIDSSHQLNCYTALSAVLVNTKSLEGTCVCAGAEPPIILRRHSGNTEEACSFGPLLGIDPDAQFTSTQFILEQGDLITLTTDGITEARKPHGRDSSEQVPISSFFGTSGIGSVLRADHPITDTSLTSLQEKIVTLALNWAGGEQRDDICLLMAQIV